MLPSAIALLVALALGEARGTPRAEMRAAVAASNAARAKVGLLPRKASVRTGSVYRGGRRLVPVSGVAPTFLGEPGTLADATGRVPPPPDPPALRLAAAGVITDVTLSLRYDP